MELGYGRAYLEFEPTDNCQIILPSELPSAGKDVIEKAINLPFGKGLDHFNGIKSASILISDITRPAPSHIMLPPLTRKLIDIGASHILVVFALGTHRIMSHDEERVLLKDCYGMPHIQHDIKRCVNIGETSRGTPVEIFEDVMASDLIVATGNIEYHYYAGYSGGAKAILPGVSSEKSVVRNHELMREPNSISGRLDSPVRIDMEEAANIAELDFILNVVLNSRKEIVKAVAGDFIKAHRMGAETVDLMYRKFVDPAEIVITCAGGWPKDINLFQAQKALDNAKDAAIKGGTIILLAECGEGYGNPVFERWAKEAICAEDCVGRFGFEYEFGGHKAALIARESLRHNLILVSCMPKDKVEMGFFNHAINLEEALSMAIKRHGKDARTLVMPYGNLTLVTSKQ
ncbi:MAG: nickel-dependent lactate racemase [Methanotrichaceae archaeon]|nr:nickel-dependent lactate racemase [Methanotrichaceae archaeon]